MKRVLTASAIAVSLVLVLAGCGGDAGRAKALMQQGDSELAEMKPASTRLTASTNLLFQEVFAGGKVDAAGFQKNADKVKKAADQLTQGSAKARNSYSSIDKLKEVGGYKKYAALRIKELDLNDQGVAELKTFIDTWLSTISSAGFDPVAFVGAAKGLSVKTTQIADEIEKLETEAASLKKSEKL